MMNQDTLSDTFDVIKSELINRRVELCETPDLIGFFGAMVPNEARTMNCEIKRFKGRETREYAHIVITWLDGARYEPLLYVL